MCDAKRDRERDGMLTAAMERIDALHAADPKREVVDGVECAAELLYARRMTSWLDRLAPKASDALSLAVRCQHLERWKVPRSEHPSGRRGYKQWRTRLAREHAMTAAKVLQDVGFDEPFIERVQSLIQKRHLKTDPEAQTLEDAACLVFLEWELEDFAAKHEEEKLIRILQRTWLKMSPQARSAALRLPLPVHLRRLLEKALAE